MQSPKKSEKTFTYADYLNWPEEERWELIDGVPYDECFASAIFPGLVFDLTKIFPPQPKIVRESPQKDLPQKKLNPGTISR